MNKPASHQTHPILATVTQPQAFDGDVYFKTQELHARGGGGEQADVQAKVFPTSKLFLPMRQGFKLPHTCPTHPQEVSPAYPQKDAAESAYSQRLSPAKATLPTAVQSLRPNRKFKEGIGRPPPSAAAPQ